ncbi:MAG: aminotransferase class I/II-fold pyridoxal phosphate-dependent enzyme, partial [Rhodospirillaceae bacterium]|nr:aminotransferase class I/II-fold pyridoxal phosphate-dependent enzyme [Rhodospirillaceae bacterium]
MTLLPDFKLEVYLGKWEFAAKWHMTPSDAQTLSIKELLALADAEDRAAWDDLPLSYIETWGTPKLRRAIAATYDGAKPEDVLAFAGAEEGLYCAMHALLGKDDHALIVTPNYQSAEQVPLSLCAVEGVALREDRNWDLDLDELKARIRPNTRLISINFPHNPTGKIIDRATFDALVALCRKHGIWLFSDEVYRGLEIDPAKRLPAAVEAYERGLSLGVMSKAYGLPGLRVGWIASKDHALLERMERIKHYLSICNAGPSEHLAVIALKARDKVIGRNVALLKDNLQAVERFFADYPGRFQWYRPDGGCVAFPRYLGSDGVESFCHRLAEEAGIVLLPASIYTSSLNPVAADRFRIGFGRSYTKQGLDEMR